MLVLHWELGLVEIAPQMHQSFSGQVDFRIFTVDIGDGTMELTRKKITVKTKVEVHFK